ncbi:hypothetical protein RSAG8_06719, partial [Rhizoctonia solani AG-8 WAC10335]
MLPNQGYTGVQGSRSRGPYTYVVAASSPATDCTRWIMNPSPPRNRFFLVGVLTLYTEF